MITKKEQQNIIKTFFQWYYIDGIRVILEAWNNFLVFILNYFSFTVLLKTFFSPWKKYYESYGRGFDLKRYLNTFFSNMLFRLLGMIVRTILVMICLIFQALIILIGITVFLSWVFLPILLIIGIVIGFQIIGLI